MRNLIIIIALLMSATVLAQSFNNTDNALKEKMEYDYKIYSNLFRAFFNDIDSHYTQREAVLIQEINSLKRTNDSLRSAVYKLSESLSELYVFKSYIEKKVSKVDKTIKKRAINQRDQLNILHQTTKDKN